MYSTTENKELSQTDIDIVMWIIDCSITKDMALRILEISHPHIYKYVVNNWNEYYQLYLQMKENVKLKLRISELEEEIKKMK